MDKTTIPISYVGELRRAMAELPDDHPMLFQVVATNGQAWNMGCEFSPDGLNWAAVLQLKHRDLERLPQESFTDSAKGNQP